MLKFYATHTLALKIIRRASDNFKRAAHVKQVLKKMRVAVISIVGRLRLVLNLHAPNEQRLNRKLKHTLVMSVAAA
jgi:hypothetical protein